MTGIASIRAAITVLIGLAATQEQELLALAPPGQDGSAARWAAAPLVAHNTEFRRQQVQRLMAIEHGQAPPDFAEPIMSPPSFTRRSPDGRPTGDSAG